MTDFGFRMVDFGFLHRKAAKSAKDFETWVLPFLASFAMRFHVAILNFVCL